MGCGQSKIHLYPRKSKSKANGKKSGHAKENISVDSDGETDEDEGHFEEKCANRDQEKPVETEEQTRKDVQAEEQEVSISLLRAKNLSLLQSQEISSSQQNFFQMLDKKIEEGPDYDSASETEIALEEARLNALVQHWESVSLTASLCSSASRSQQTTPVRQIAVKQLAQRVLMQSSVPQQVLNTTDLLPHSALQANQLLTTNTMPKISQNTQQQLLLTQMNTMNSRMLQQMAAASQMQTMPSSGLNLTDTAKTISNNTNVVANSSNPLGIMGHITLQTPPQYHYTHLKTLPVAGTSQLLPTPNVSPRRLTTTADGRLIMNPLAAQQMQSQFLTSGAGLPQPPPGASYIMDDGRVSQQASTSNTIVPTSVPLQMTCYPAVPQHTPLSNDQLHQQQLQQQQTSTPPPPPPQSQSQQYYGEIMHNMQATQPPPPTEYRFPPVISVQRLAPQVQRQLRETQELIKDSCPLYAAGYGSPGPPMRDQQNRNPSRRPTLETQFSQELS